MYMCVKGVEILIARHKWLTIDNMQRDFFNRSTPDILSVIIVPLNPSVS